MIAQHHIFDTHNLAKFSIFWGKKTKIFFTHTHSIIQAYLAVKLLWLSPLNSLFKVSVGNEIKPNKRQLPIANVWSCHKLMSVIVTRLIIPKHNRNFIIEQFFRVLIIFIVIHSNDNFTVFSWRWFWALNFIGRSSPLNVRHLNKVKDLLQLLQFWHVFVVILIIFGID